MSGCDWQKEKFSVAMNLTPQGQKNFDSIDWGYCECKEPAICGLLDEKKRLQCANCGKIIKK